MRPVRRRRRAEREPSGARLATSSLVVEVAMRRPRTLAIPFVWDRRAEREQGDGDPGEEVPGALDADALDLGKPPDHGPSHSRGAPRASYAIAGVRGDR